MNTFIVVAILAFLANNAAWMLVDSIMGKRIKLLSERLDLANRRITNANQRINVLRIRLGFDKP